MSNLIVAVPTTTILAVNPENGYEVAVLRSGAKHNGKLVLPGGRVKIGRQTHLETGVAELKEELNLGIKNPEFFCLLDKVRRDVRIMTIEKWADGNPIPKEYKGKMVEAHFCSDIAIWGTAVGEPVVDGDEGVEAKWYDVRYVNESDFALDHGTLVSCFKFFCECGEKPPVGWL